MSKFQAVPGSENCFSPVRRHGTEDTRTETLPSAARASQGTSSSTMDEDIEADEEDVGSVAAALRSRHGHSTQPESKQARDTSYTFSAPA